MKIVKLCVALTAMTALAGCFSEERGLGVSEISDKTVDGGYDAKPLTDLVAGIWVDPNGCHHWIIDDGNEGYMDARLDRYGKPVCAPIAPPNHATGDYKKGTIFNDPA
ncbi:hypothetical protein [Cognatishimia activa]|uniref:Lipoprotein n=1 Tax=Cognatishimia activa TaxID=1715691 RepID=A0A0P1ISV6_9RHOB|nr:hypothetical protein [Cognatishimia activa]MEE2944147.1 hypothetical protein [Pseudomonadota bacterium]CUI70444.1 hypothetical protein TA5113_01209 [Cognatishimia activa]CUK26567.1 hypothetical protein TA5114_02382 [Cognatishimia activa]